MVAFSKGMVSPLLSSLILFLSVCHVTALNWTDTSVAKGAFTNSTITSILPVATTTAKPKPKPKPKPATFRIQTVRSGRRYQTGKRYWAFTGSDAVVVDDIQDAAWFYLENDQLKCGKNYVSLDSGNGYAVLELSSKPARHGVQFGKNQWGNIEITGDDFTLGQGHGSFCVSGDGNIFVVASKRPPFQCAGIGLRPKAPRNPANKPSQPPPQSNDQSPKSTDEHPQHNPSEPDSRPENRPDRPDRPDPPHQQDWQDEGSHPSPNRPEGHRPPRPNSPPSQQDGPQGESPTDPSSSGDYSDHSGPPGHGGPPNRRPHSWQDHRPGHPEWRPHRPHRPQPPSGSGAEDPHPPNPTPTRPSGGHNNPAEPGYTQDPTWGDHPDGPYNPPSPTETDVDPEPNETYPPKPDPSSDPDVPDDGEEDPGHGPGGEHDGPVYWGDN